MKKPIKVVGAIIENDDNEILCALRSPRMSVPDRWEFPGGKVEKDESLEQAIEREIKEELDCIVKFNSEFLNHTHEYDDVTVNLITVICTLISGVPQAQEHSKLIWLKRENLPSLKWAPADIPTVNKLVKEQL